MQTATPWWVFLLGIPFGAPWIAFSAWYWLKTPREQGEALPSMGELLRRRLLEGR